VKVKLEIGTMVANQLVRLQHYKRGCVDFLFGDLGPNVRLFQLKKEDNNTINVEVNLLEASKILKVIWNCRMHSIHNFILREV
jgi:hypothetical protein